MTAPVSEEAGGADRDFRVARDTVDLDRVRYLFRSPSATIASLLCGIIVAYFGVLEVGIGPTAVWFGTLTLVIALRLEVRRRFRATVVSSAQHGFWARCFEIGAITTGLVWGLAGFAFANSPSATATAVFTTTIGCLLAGSVFAMAVWPRAFHGYVLSAGMIPSLTMLAVGGTGERAVGILGIAYVCVIIVWGRVVRRVLTRTMELRHENRALAAELAIARNHAEEIDRTRHEGFANLSHELRTPLNAIIGFGQAIEAELWGDLGNPRYREYGRHIVQAGQHLEILIGEAMDLSRLESGRVELEEREVDPRELARDCGTLVAGRARAKELTLNVNTADRLPQLYCDPPKIRQVLINLLSNSVKFTANGGRIDLTVRRLGDGRLEFAVSDSGHGIAPEELERVMEPFVRGGEPGIQAAEGLGLGLALSRALADLHGGTLHLDSKLGEGTTAYLRLPKDRLRD